MTEEEFKKFVELEREGYGATRISDEIGGSKSTIQLYLTVLRIHGEEKFHDYIFKPYVRRSNEELNAIAANVDSGKYSFHRLGLLFLVNPKSLEYIYTHREELGLPSDVEPAPIPVPLRPTSGGQRWRTDGQPLRKRNRPKGKYSEPYGASHKVPENAKEAYNRLVETGKSSTWNCNATIDDKSGDLSALVNEFDISGLPVLEHDESQFYGRASAPIVNHLGKKPYKSYQAVATIKTKKALKLSGKLPNSDEKNADQSESVNNEPEVTAEQNIRSSDELQTKRMTEFLSKIGDNFQGRKASEYDPSKSGRKAFYDPFSEGFSDLPPEIQIQSLLALEKERRFGLEVLKKFVVSGADFAPEIPMHCIKTAVVSVGIDPEIHKRCNLENPSDRQIAKMLGIPRQTYFDIKGKLGKPDKFCNGRVMIKAVFDKSCGQYGKRRIAQALRQLGYNYAPSTVAKLMKEEGLSCKPALRKPRKTTTKVDESVKFPNVIMRKFVGDYAYQKLFTDVTEVHAPNSGFKKLYFSPVMDGMTGKIVAASVGYNHDTELVCGAVGEALRQIKHDKEVIVHTDNGSLYKSDVYMGLIKSRPNTIQSMSAIGKCVDNGAIESFFGRFKREAFRDRVHYTETDVFEAIAAFIEEYNTHRIKLPIIYSKEQDEGESEI